MNSNKNRREKKRHAKKRKIMTYFRWNKFLRCHIRQVSIKLWVHVQYLASTAPHNYHRHSGTTSYFSLHPLLMQCVCALSIICCCCYCLYVSPHLWLFVTECTPCSGTYSVAREVFALTHSISLIIIFQFRNVSHAFYLLATAQVLNANLLLLFCYMCLFEVFCLFLLSQKINTKREIKSGNKNDRVSKELSSSSFAERENKDVELVRTSYHEIIIKDSRNRWLNWWFTQTHTHAPYRATAANKYSKRILHSSNGLRRQSTPTWHRFHFGSHIEINSIVIVFRLLFFC